MDESCVWTRVLTLLSFCPHAAPEKEAPGSSYGVLDRSGEGMLQHRQLQLPHGYHRRAKYGARFSSQENGLYS